LGISGRGFVMDWMPFLSPNSVKALEETRSTDPHQWPFFFHCWTHEERPMVL